LVVPINLNTNEVKMKQKKCFILICILSTVLLGWSSQLEFSFDRYHTPDELNRAIENFARLNPKITKLYRIAISPGKNEINLV